MKSKSRQRSRKSRGGREVPFNPPSYIENRFNDIIGMITHTVAIIDGNKLSKNDFMRLYNLIQSLINEAAVYIFSYRALYPVLYQQLTNVLMGLYTTIQDTYKDRL